MLYIFLQKTYCSQSNSLGSMLISTLKTCLECHLKHCRKSSIPTVNLAQMLWTCIWYASCLICSTEKFRKTSKWCFPMSPHTLQSQGNGKQPSKFTLQSCNSLFIEWWVRHLSQLTALRSRNPSTRPQECKLVTLLISSLLQWHLSFFFFLPLSIFFKPICTSWPAGNQKSKSNLSLSK